MANNTNRKKRIYIEFPIKLEMESSKKLILIINN